MLPLALVVLVLASLAGAWLVKPLRQPAVVGQMATGIALGPSVFGWLAPGLHAALFPASSLAAIQGLGTVAVVLYMFIVAARMDHVGLRAAPMPAVAVAATAIVLPLLAGGAAAALVVGRHDLFPGHVPAAAIGFGAAAVAATALPVMARIIDECRIDGTRAAALALVAGSTVDLAVWCVMALVLAAASARPLGAVVTIGGAIAFVAALLAVRRPLARMLEGLPRATALAVVAAGLLAAAWTTTTLGLHAAFGAFAFGLVLPRGWYSAHVPERLQPAVAYLVLPIFFAASGLATDAGRLIAGDGLLILVVMLALKFATKGGAVWAVARSTGVAPRDAATIAALMSTGGVVELIIAAIGFGAGIISATLYSVLVVMAILTTAAAPPVILLARRRHPWPAPVAPLVPVPAPEGVVP